MMKSLQERMRDGQERYGTLSNSGAGTDMKNEAMRLFGEKKSRGEVVDTLQRGYPEASQAEINQVVDGLMEQAPTA